MLIDGRVSALRITSLVLHTSWGRHENHSALDDRDEEVGEVEEQFSPLPSSEKENAIDSPHHLALATPNKLVPPTAAPMTSSSSALPSIR